MISHRFGGDSVVKAWPTGTRIEFGLRVKKRAGTSSTPIHALPFFFEQRARIGILGGRLS